MAKPFRARISTCAAGYSFSQTQISVRSYMFGCGTQNVVIAYTAGYPITPPEIAQACIELVALRYRERTRIGEVSKSLGGAETVTYSQKDLSDGIKTLLATIPSCYPGCRNSSDDGLGQHRHDNTREHPVITAHLAGEERVLARLRDMPVAIKSGLVRAITKLGIDLQRKVQQDELTGQMLTARSGSLMSSIDLRVDQGATVVAATVLPIAHMLALTSMVSQVRSTSGQACDHYARPLDGQSRQVNQRSSHSRQDGSSPSGSFCARHLGGYGAGHSR